MTETVCYCSFCGKSQHEVKKLIAGPATVFICDECVVLCAEIVLEEKVEQAALAVIKGPLGQLLAHAGQRQKVQALARDSGSGPEGGDGTAPGEAPQSGGDSRIAQTASPNSLKDTPS